MFVSLTVRSAAPGLPATDLGFLLHKHPGKAQSFSQSVGTAHVFFPVASAQQCTAALLLEVDPISLVRNKKLGGQDAFALAQYVNDRPYAASSMLAVALGKVFATARQGRCEARPALVEHAWDTEIVIPALPCRGGAEWAARLFEPLGWHAEATPVPLDPAVPDWGDSRYVDLRLTGQMRVRDALGHLYVLLPVLDDAKHYWVGEDEVGKLIRASAGWLATHPERDEIAARYLAHRRSLTRTVTERLLAAGEDTDMPDDAALPQLPATGTEPVIAPVDRSSDLAGGEAGAVPDAAAGDVAPPAAGDAAGTEGRAAASGPDAGEAKPVRLADARRDAIIRELADAGATSVADLGCGEGRLLAALIEEPRYSRLLGADVSVRALERAAARLHLERMPERRRERIDLVQTSLTYRDARLAGFDAIVLQEVLEHIDPPRLAAVTRNVLGLGARTVIVTTPNVEYNARYEWLTGMRHPDHRFEWDRAQFASWATAAAKEARYDVEISGIGEADPEVGQPSQLAVFTQRPEAGPGPGKEEGAR